MQEVLLNRHYTRNERRNGNFVIRVENEFIRMISFKPLKYDISHNSPTLFTYKSAISIAENFKHRNPTIYLCTGFKGKDINID